MTVMTRPDIFFIFGCTGSGKGAVARELATRIGGEIISVDSMKVYRRMDIGTAKPDPQTRRRLPHHLIDVVEPSESFSTAQFVKLADAAIHDINRRGRVPIAVGGTALYIKSLSEGLFEGPSADPQLRAILRTRAHNEGVEVLHSDLASVDPDAARRIHRNDLRRVVRALEVFQLTGTAISTLQTQWDRDHPARRCAFVALRRTLEDQSGRTNRRTKRLIELGWVDEVRALLEESPPIGKTARQALGYNELIEYIHGRVALEEAVERIKIATRRLAKAQRTWFKRFRSLHWIYIEPDDPAEQTADRALDHWNSLCST